MKRLLLTTVLSVGTWFILKLILVPEDPLFIRLGSDKPLSESSISFDTVTPWGRSQKAITPEQIISEGGQPHEVTVIIEPLGQSNPDGRGSEIWVHKIASDIEQFDSTNWNSISLPSPWKHDVRRGAVVFISGPPTPLKIHLKAVKSVTLRLLRHPWSGQSRITVDGISQMADLYASEKDSGQIQKKILLPLPLDVTQHIKTTLPRTAKNLRLTFTDEPRLLLLKHVEWKSRNLWDWVPGSDIEIGQGGELLERGKEGLLLRIKGSDGWISFKNIRLMPFFLPNKEDVLLIVVLCFVWWSAIEAYRPRNQIGIFMLQQSHWAKYALPCFALWLVYWLAFFPAIMSLDSLDQWGQALNFKFNASHPAFHTLLNWLITRLWFSPAAVSLAQILAMSSLIGWGLSKFQRYGVPSIVLWIVCGLFALSPVMGIMTITLWKDIPYSISLLWVSLILLELIESKGRWLADSWRNVLLLGIVLFFVAIFRHNGTPVALGIILVLGLVYSTFWRRVLIVFIIAFSIYAAVCGPLYRVLDVAGIKNIYKQVLMLHQVSAAIAAGTPLTEEEQNILNRILPIEQWKTLYRCEYAGPLIYDSPFNEQELNDNAAAFRHIWLSLIIRNPGAIFKHQLCAGNLVWNLSRHYYLAIYKEIIVPNEVGLYTQSQLPWLRDFLSRLVTLTEMPQLAWFFWRPALYLYLTLLLTTFMAIRRRKATLLLFALPVLIQSVILFLVNTAQDFRYQFPVYLVGLMSICLLFLQKETENHFLKKVN